MHGSERLQEKGLHFCRMDRYAKSVLTFDDYCCSCRTYYTKSVSCLCQKAVPLNGRRLYIFKVCCGKSPCGVDSLKMSKLECRKEVESQTDMNVT
jgi:hypothetical protein